MSRSYKKTPIHRMSLWGRSMKVGKQYSNRKVRRILKNPEVPVVNGRYYKAYGFDSWDLWEYKSFETKQDAIDRWEKEQIELKNGVKTYRTIQHDWSLSDAIDCWAEFYKRK